MFYFSMRLLIVVTVLWPCINMLACVGHNCINMFIESYKMFLVSFCLLPNLFRISSAMKTGCSEFGLCLL
ncbi:hypothetical protein RND81_10G049300 [Saponaria officinalis]|uniref:Uncharacterized protein n=1 Tax=Saponaria officinalis TaxID=3572 RepID=A0AAW1HYT2_SAPOF